MTLDPRWSIFLSVALGILAFVSAIPDWANSGIDPTTAKHLIWWLGIAVGIGNIVNAALGAIPSKTGQTAGFYLGPKAPAATP